MKKQIVPKVGEFASVTIKHNSNVLKGFFPTPEPTSLTFTGRILPSEAWDPYDSIRMAGDNLDHPIRILAIRNIIAWNGDVVQVVSQNPNPRAEVAKPRTVEVVGSKGTLYTVAIFADGSMACNCKGFGFNKRCRHITELAEKEKV